MSDEIPSFDKCISEPVGSDFFDQLSMNSAMMSSFAQSKSSDIFTQCDELSALKIEEKPDALPSDSDSKSFFDLLSPDVTDKSQDFVNFDLNNEGPYPSPLQGFEGSSDPLSGPETDRSRDAWIPSDSTRKALIMAATSTPGSYTPDKQLLTMPGVVLEEELVDRLTALIRKLFGEEEARKRSVLTMQDVAQDENGLRELIQNHCFKAAVNLTSKLLSVYSQGLNKLNQPSKHSVKSIQLWFTRFCLLVKIGSYDVALSESNVWWNLDRPDLYYQFYPEIYGGKLGTMVPFQMRLLIAMIPAYVSNYSEALERLYFILGTCRQILKHLDSGKSEDGSPIELLPREREISKHVWSSREARVQHSIINVALMSKQYVLAIEVLQILIKNNISCNQRRALQSALGRIFLQLGDVKNAEKCFTAAKQLKRNQPGTLNSNTADLRELVDKGLLLVAENKHKLAYECFQKASMLDPTNIMVINNMSFCLLYMGQLKNAISSLVGVIKSNPSVALHEALLLNVCTLFELESSDMMQKEVLLKEIAKYKGDGLNVDCLKAIVQR